MNTSVMTKKIKEYEAWRSRLSQAITDYHVWLTKNQQSHSARELRLFDVIQGLEHDRIQIAFIADDARGKTETINALFFSDYNLRLFPTKSNHTCPSEIRWNPDEEPSLKLLPIETKISADTITYLKTVPNLWEKFQLDPHSATGMQATFAKLAEQKKMTQLEADELGLWDPSNKAMVEDFENNSYVRIPAWRYAIINLPHPILKSGLSTLR